MHVLPKGQSKANTEEVSDRAIRAVANFRKMQHGLTSYARAITGNKKVRVQAAGGVPRTDGDVIFYQPPIALGDNTPHDRFNCDKRDNETGLLICGACRIREEVLVNIYHEIAHIAFGSFEVITESEKKSAIDYAVSQWGGSYEKQIRQAIGSLSLKSYQAMSGIISPYLPHVINCLEDARVDRTMFNERKGTRKMFNADVRNLLENGMPSGSDSPNHQYRDLPLNSQITLALYFEAAEFSSWRDYLHEKIIEDIDDPALQELVAKLKESNSAKATYHLGFPVLARLRELSYYKTEEEQEEEQAEEEPEQDNEESDDDSDDNEHEEGEDSDDEESEGSEGGDLSDESSDEGDAGEDDADTDEENNEGDPTGGDEGPDGGDCGAEDEPSEPGEGADGDETSAREGASDKGGADEGENDERERETDPTGDPEDGPEDAADSEDQSADGVEHRESDQDGDSDLGGESGGGEPASSEAGDEGDAEGDVPAGEGATGDGADGTVGSDVSEEDGSGREGNVPAESSPGGEGARDLDEELPDSGDDGAEAEGDEPDESWETPEALESGADEGEGGIEVQQVLPDQGTPEDVALVLQVAHEAVDSPEEETVAEEKAVMIAIIQGEYFETPSTEVLGIEEYRYGHKVPGWNAKNSSKEDRIRLGIECDMDIPESVLGPALLKTRRIFDDNKTSAYQPNMRSGRVNAKVLGRRAWSGDDRLFGKRRIPAKQDYAVQIMIDISSSNLGDNLALVKRAAYAQAELCQRAGVKFSIMAHSCTLSYGEEYSGFTMNLHHVKDWDEPWNSDMKQRMADIVALGGNLDGHAMEWARKSVMSQDVTDRILLYYTDGKMPAANHDEELEVLERQIKLCRRDGVTLLGVGIRTDSPIRHGLDTVQVDSDDELPLVIEHLGKRLGKNRR